MKITRFAITTVAILLGATTISAQNRKPISASEMSNYVVSAKAGVVNVVEGEASVIRAKPFAMPNMLISGDELLTGDTVKTGARGRAEVLLNPGCYLRLGEGSEFVFLFDSFTSNKIKLLQGSAVIEASAIDGLILVETPKAEFEITRTGLYRFNVGADAKAEVAVRKGRVLAGNTMIKNGKRAVVEGSTAAIANLNKQEVDALDDWSKGRAKSLIAANSRLSNQGMRRSLSMSLVSNTWIYDPFCRCYTFLPYTGGFASPYGGNYSVCNPYWYYSGSRYNDGGWYGGGSSGNGQPSSGGRSGGGSGPGGGTPTGGGTGNPSRSEPPSREVGPPSHGGAGRDAGPRRP